jgi:hypothetical protein
VRHAPVGWGRTGQPGHRRTRAADGAGRSGAVAARPGTGLSTR